MRIRVNLITPESFREFTAGAAAYCSGPAFHRFDVIIDRVLLAQPRPLACMAGKHRLLHRERRSHVDVKVRRLWVAVAIDALSRIHEIKMRNTRQGWGG